MIRGREDQKMSDYRLPPTRGVVGLCRRTPLGRDRRSIAAHLDSCPACTAALATFDDADDTFVAQLRDPRRR